MAKWRDPGDIRGLQLVDLPPVWLVGAILLVRFQATVFPGAVHRFFLTDWVGGVLIAAGLALMVWALAAFRAHQTTAVPHNTPARIITTGPFARSRNPIYLGDVMVLTGVVLWWGAWPSLLLIPLFVWVLARRFIAPEEARMKESFGAEFDAFAEKTPRWL